MLLGTVLSRYEHSLAKFRAKGKSEGNPAAFGSFYDAGPSTVDVSLRNHALVSFLPQDYDPRQTVGECMSPMRGESRRSTRVPLKVVISAKGLNRPLSCDGETMVVNRHGALVLCTVPLLVGLNIEIHVIMTDKRADAEVVYVDPERRFVCGIALDKPENIWGLSFPPDDWYETHET